MSWESETLSLQSCPNICIKAPLSVFTCTLFTSKQILRFLWNFKFIISAYILYQLMSKQCYKTRWALLFSIIMMTSPVSSVILTTILQFSFCFLKLSFFLGDYIHYLSLNCGKSSYLLYSSVSLVQLVSYRGMHTNPVLVNSISSCLFL